MRTLMAASIAFCLLGVAGCGSESGFHRARGPATDFRNDTLAQSADAGEVPSRIRSAEHFHEGNLDVVFVVFDTPLAPESLVTERFTVGLADGSRLRPHEVRLTAVSQNGAAHTAELHLNATRRAGIRVATVEVVGPVRTIQGESMRWQDAEVGDSSTGIRPIIAQRWSGSVAAQICGGDSLYRTIWSLPLGDGSLDESKVSLRDTPLVAAKSGVRIVDPEMPGGRDNVVDICVPQTLGEVATLTIQSGAVSSQYGATLKTVTLMVR